MTGARDSCCRAAALGGPAWFAKLMAGDAEATANTSGSIATSRGEHTTRLTVRRLSSRPHRLCRRRGFPSTCGQDFKLPARPIGWRKIYGSPGVSCIALDRPIGLSCDLFIRSLAYQLKFA